MNRKQRACLTTGLILLVVAGLFPPTVHPIVWPYNFLFTTVETVNLTNLSVEWALIVLVTAGSFLLFRRSHDSETQKSESISTSRGKLWLLVSLVILFATSTLSLGFYSYAITKKVGRLKEGIQDMRGILFVNPFLPVGALRPSPPPFLETIPDFIPACAGDSVKVFSHGGFEIPCYSVRQAQQMVADEYDRLVDPTQRRNESNNDTLKQIKEELDKLN